MSLQHKFPGAAVLAALLVAVLPSLTRADDDFDDLQEKAIKTAVQKVATCVVQIETSGGTEIVRTGPQGLIRRGIGPTSGLIVAPDGYIISSAFNFANKPSKIRVAVPGHPERYVAEVVATDQTRMLTLLKLVSVQGTLPVPVPAPKKETRVGFTAIAVGRTLAATDRPPSVSVGIISAVDRIWGRAVQTDAKVSPANYGGPLVDLHGRVLGVLVPASPRGEGETAGFEWYDSGIGFAIPLEDINHVLPQMMKGTQKKPMTLRRGLLGITLRGQDLYGETPVVGAVAPGSVGEKIGLKNGDVLKEIDGKPIANQAQMMHALGTKYEGDAVSLKVQRGKEDVTFDKVVLAGIVTAFGKPFLGILPLRDDTKAGVQIRYVYPKSPAETAGLKVGDRLMKIGSAQGPVAGLQPIANRDSLISLFQNAKPGNETRFEVKRKGDKTETVTVKLGEAPDTVPDVLPFESSTVDAKAKADKKEDRKDGKRDRKKEDTKEDGKDDGKKDDTKEDTKDDGKEGKTGLLKRTTAARDRRYWIYVPYNYDPKRAHALVVWLHPPHKNTAKVIDDFTWAWQPACEDYHMILVGPVTENERGWTQGESEFVQEAMKEVLDNYNIDKQRIVAHGMGVGGDMAFYLGFHVRNLIRGVATVGAALTSNARDKVPNQPLSFYLVAGGKDPLCPSIKESKGKLDEKKYPVIYREVELLGAQYIDGRLGVRVFDELARWIDSLDQL
jgi:S1-C subfamily serine protease